MAMTTVARDTLNDSASWPTVGQVSIYAITPRTRRTRAGIIASSEPPAALGGRECELGVQR